MESTKITTELEWTIWDKKNLPPQSVDFPHVSIEVLVMDIHQNVYLGHLYWPEKYLDNDGNSFFEWRQREGDGHEIEDVIGWMPLKLPKITGITF